MGVQRIKREIRLNEWGEQVRQLRESGKTVTAWCETNGIKKSTFYRRQREVAERLSTAVALGQSTAPAIIETASFAEYRPPVRSASSGVTLYLSCGTLEIHNGADEEIIASTLRAIKSIC